MAINLVELTKQYLTPELVRKAASFVGESEPSTQNALNGIVPSLIAALTNQVSSPDGAEKLNRILEGANYNGSALNNLSSLFSGGEATQKAVASGKDILTSLLGNKTDGLVDQIARFAGIRSGSSSSLLSLAVPLIFNVLSRQRTAAGTGPSALASLLGEQKGFLNGLLPAGIASMLGWSGYQSARQPQPASDDSQRKSPWLIPLLAIGALVLLALGWLLQRPASVVNEASLTAGAIRMASLDLPGGMKISVPEGSFNYSLGRWLASTSDTTVPKRFVFDNLNFESSSTQLTAQSVPTVDSLVTIMKAYPNVAVRLEGYTDNTGDADANKKLSLERAVAVKEMVVKGGIEGGRITGTDGWGQEKPIASNDTEDGRAKNRRTELVVERR